MDGVATVDGLLGALHVGDPELGVARLGPGPTSVPAGDRWSLLAVARGEVDVLGTTLGPGDAVLTRGRGALAVRVAGEGATVLVTRFALHGEARRLARLPEPAVVYADSEFCRLLIERVTGEVEQHRTADVVSARLLDWLVVDTVRDVLAGEPATIADPDVAAALAAVHADPAAAWTVDGLARRAGVGRAAFARRFREAVGTAPLSYVREHRLDLAERALLAEPDATVAAVARRVGYASPFSFSAAFRRHRGVAPSALRSLL
ncbi:cupin [Actinomycetospora sp. NBRC 106375]|nr:cupin [Actinomycetospora sp. NBRC 106375]